MKFPEHLGAVETGSFGNLNTAALRDRAHLGYIVKKLHPTKTLADWVGTSNNLHGFVKRALKAKFSVDTSTMNTFDLVTLFCR